MAAPVSFSRWLAGRSEATTGRVQIPHRMTEPKVPENGAGVLSPPLAPIRPKVAAVPPPRKLPYLRERLDVSDRQAVPLTPPAHVVRVAKQEHGAARVDDVVPRPRHRDRKVHEQIVRPH